MWAALVGEGGLYLSVVSLLWLVCQPMVRAWSQRGKPAPNREVQDRTSQQLRRTGAWALLGTWAGFLGLAWCFATLDWQVVAVLTHAHSKMPLPYRLAALWGGHEGSLLLWVTMLGSWWWAVACQARHHMPATAYQRLLIVLAWVWLGMLGLLVWTSNPFVITDRVFHEGMGLNPMLQDPGLVVHPPLLYLGYVGFSVPFAFALAALWEGEMTAAWAAWCRPWTALAWGWLTVGMVLGSWWAYRQLGWGGWWFWDPVENASLMPWIAGVALMHRMVVVSKTGEGRLGTAAWSVVTFALSLLGTFLVRSGVLVSVHAFAVDPARGVAVLVLLGLTLLVGVGAITWRFAAWEGGAKEAGPAWRLGNRQTWLWLNQAVLTTWLFSVALGTLYPMVLQGLGLGRVSVGPPYFNAWTVPLVSLLAWAMGWGVQAGWKGSGWRTSWQVARWWCLGAPALALGLPRWLGLPLKPAWLWGGSLGMWLLALTIHHAVQWARRHGATRVAWGMVLAHLGVAWVVLGVAMVTVYGVEQHVVLAPGQSTHMEGDTVTLWRVRPWQHSNYTSDTAALVWTEASGKRYDVLPEVRRYDQPPMVLPKVDVDVRWDRDLMVALGQPVWSNEHPVPYDHMAWTFRLYKKPGLRWVWAGGLLMALGAWWSRRRHVPSGDQNG